MKTLRLSIRKSQLDIEKKSHLILVVGDFSTKLGQKLNSEEEQNIEKFGIGKRSDKGSTLIN